MAKDLLWRGMLAGILAALLATLFARAVAAPQVDQAIAFEASQGAHSHDHGPDHGAGADSAGNPDPVEAAAPVSRETQKGAGLLTAMALYGAAIGGIFALLFAYAYGRLARIGPRSLALGLAILAFVVVALVPAIKYPPNPPAVSLSDTIQVRTAAYFAMLVISIAAAVVAFRIRTILSVRLSAFDAATAGIASFLVIIAIAHALLPRFEEGPADFPAQVLWKFRLASLGIQGLLWLVIGLSFGWMADRLIRRTAPAR